MALQRRPPSPPSPAHNDHPPTTPPRSPPTPTSSAPSLSSTATSDSSLATPFEQLAITDRGAHPLSRADDKPHAPTEIFEQQERKPLPDAEMFERMQDAERMQSRRSTPGSE